MKLDTSKSMAFEKSKMQLFALALGGIVFVLIGIWLVRGGAVTRKGEWTILFGWVSIVFFGVATLLILRRLVSPARTVLTLSPEGFCDTRISKETIPWSSVLTISTWEMRSSKFVIVLLEPAFEATLTINPIQRFTRRANAALGADGLFVNAMGVKLSFGELINYFTNYAKSHNPSVRITT